MVCRARSGDTAPALGARLSANTGISGECLRTGKMQHCTDTENDPIGRCRKSAAASVYVRLPFCRFRAGAASTVFLKFFLARPPPLPNPTFPFWSNSRRWRNGLAQRNRTEPPRPCPGPASAIEKSAALGLAAGIGSRRGCGPGFHRFRKALASLGFGAARGGGDLAAALVIWLGWRGGDDTDARSHAATRIGHQCRQR